MKKLTFFDVEYANSKNKSICQIGIDCIDIETGESYYPELNIYVNPEDGFQQHCVQVHGITMDKVKTAPTFDKVWIEIEKYFTNSVIVGHNVAAADLDALAKNLQRYNLDIPELYYICTFEIAKNVIPSYLVPSYSLSSLCSFFGIDIDNMHDAFDDACACEDLLKALMNYSNISLKEYLHKYQTQKSSGFVQFVASPILRKSISEFYGMIRGFTIDNKITNEEADYILEWRNQNMKYAANPEINGVINAINSILADGVVTVTELVNLQGIIKNYLNTVSSSEITLATQILNGVLKGIVIDGVVSEEECRQLRIWLYDNIYLKGHYPFDYIIETIEKILMDNVLTCDEAEQLQSIISELLDPVAALQEQINSVQDKHVCLSGVFSCGDKSAVEKKIIAGGGIIDKTVKKTTDILLIGNCECQSFSYGSYGTKVKKALEYNEKGSNIQILKESDLFSQVR